MMLTLAQLESVMAAIKSNNAYRNQVMVIMRPGSRYSRDKIEFTIKTNTNLITYVLRLNDEYEVVTTELRSKNE